MTPPGLASKLQSLPPILHMYTPGSMPNCSKAARGLFVLLRTDGIFTVNALSPSSSSRQYPYHYAIRAGQNLPDKEFRLKSYLPCGRRSPRSLSDEPACRHAVGTISSLYHCKCYRVRHVVSEGSRSWSFVGSS